LAIALSVGEELEGGQIQLVLKSVQHRHDGVEVRRTKDHRGQILRRTFQTHGRLNHKAQRALSADKQLTQIVAGGVLDQVTVQLQQLTGAGNDFQAGHPVAGHTIANHLDTAGIGADIAANLAGTGRREVHRVVQPLFLGKLLQLRGDNAGLTDHGAVVRIELANLIHVIERHHDLAVGGHGSSRQTGTTARGHQCQLLLVGKAHHRLHLLDRLGKNNRQRGRRKVLGPVLAPIVEGLGVHPHLVRVDQCLEGCNHSIWGHGELSKGIHAVPEHISCVHGHQKRQIMLAYATSETGPFCHL